MNTADAFHQNITRGITAGIFMICLLCGFILPAFAGDPVNLCSRDFYMHEGFDPAWVKTYPEGKAGWLKLESDAAGRKMRIPDMKLPGRPKHSFLSFHENPAETFTFITTFPVTAQELAESPMYGLYLSQIGINWEIYVNGRLIRKEMFVTGSGDISVQRSLELLLVSVDVRNLREGTNILAFRIVGDPANKLTGFYRQNDYFIGSITQLDNRFERMKQGMLVFFYCIVGLFSVFVYISRRREKYFLYYGLMTLFMSCYIFARSPLSYILFTDSRYVFTVELVSLFMIIPMIGAMFDYFIFSRLTLFTKMYAAFCALCCTAVFISPVAVDFDILIIWQATSVIPILYYPVMIFTKGVLPDYRIIRSSEKQSLPVLRQLNICRKTMFGSYAGILLLGIAAIVVCSVADIIDAVFFSKGLLLTQYGVFGFTVSIGLIISVQFNRVHSMLEHLNIELKDKVLALHDANTRLTLSEEKYRFLVEYSADYIFMLNADGSFLSANKAFFRRMRILPDEVGHYSFSDFVYAEDSERVIAMEIVRNSFSELLAQKKKIQFKTKLKTPDPVGEPGDFIVMLEYAMVDGRDLILGKASSAPEDTLLAFFKSEHQKYSIDNYLVSAEQMSQRIAENAVKYISQQEADALRVIIREIIINAIEHGNLGITYAEKTAALDEDRYFEFIKERQVEARCRDCRVEVEYSINQKRIVCKITDEGNGFDYRKFLDDRAQEANDGMLEHGRGLFMASNYFDDIRFNRKGNQILLIKKI